MGRGRVRVPDADAREQERRERMSDLPAWEGVKECEKCGTTRIGKETLDWNTNPQQFEYEYIPDTTGDPNEIGHMEVTCPRCGHGWDEQTKDAGG